MRGYQTVYQPCCPERSLSGKAIRVPPISFHWVGSASTPQWHHFCYWPRRNHWSSTFGSELCIRYCWPHLTAVDPWVSIFGHRTVAGMVPLILDGLCTGVYYSVQSDFPDTTNIRYPQGSGLGPTMFISYTENTTPIFSTHTVQYHLFADDTQSYEHCSVLAVLSLLTRLSSCVADLANSYASLRLQLNPTKTEFILFGSRRNLAKLFDDCCAIIIGSSVIQCTDVVRDLGVLLDSDMSMQRHISKVTSVCFYHLRRLRQIWNYVSQSVMAQLVASLVITRIDYCNSILAGLPAFRLVPLQRVQNAAARLVLNLDRRAHISPALQQMHWLPVMHRVTF